MYAEWLKSSYANSERAKMTDVMPSCVSPVRDCHRRTVRAFWVLVKSIVICILFLGIGGALGPLVLVGMMMGMFPNILHAVFSWLITIPLLVVFFLYSAYAIFRAIMRNPIDYTEGVYGLVEWVEQTRIYDPTFNKKNAPNA
jgi:hypothetical protein